MFIAGERGRTTVCPERDHGENNRRQHHRGRGKTRGEAGRARLHLQAFREEVRATEGARCQPGCVKSELGWGAYHHCTED